MPSGKAEHSGSGLSSGAVPLTEGLQGKPFAASHVWSLRRWWAAAAGSQPWPVSMARHLVAWFRSKGQGAGGVRWSGLWHKTQGAACSLEPGRVEGSISFDQLPQGLPSALILMVHPPPSSLSWVLTGSLIVHPRLLHIPHSGILRTL